MYSICVVCIANYCRSPVAEQLLKRRFKNIHNITSAGIDPLYKGSMDPRSKKFLQSRSFENIIHSPRKISKTILEENDYILALDLIVLQHLNYEFKNFNNKFKLLSGQFKGLNLYDPFKFNEKDYKDVMKNIEFISNNINLNLL